jgi:hypothetical protein
MSINNTQNTDNLSVSERHYLNHIKAVRKYQQNNKDKINNKNISNYLNIKNNNDHQYSDILEQKKNHYYNNKNDILNKKKQYYIDNIDVIKQKKYIYYHTVVKPKKEQEKLLKLQS